MSRARRRGRLAAHASQRLADGARRVRRDRRIGLEYEPVWEGTRGHLEIEDAWLE